MVGKVSIYAMIIAIVGLRTFNPPIAKVCLTLAVSATLYLLGSLQLQVQKVGKLQVLNTVKSSENTHIFPLLTHLEPTIRVSDGQIPPDTVTHPLHH